MTRMTPPMPAQHDIASAENIARRRHGQNVLSQIDGHQGEAVVDSLADISPALGHHVAAFAFGDIYDRPGLDPRSRQLVTLGALTALGGCEPPAARPHRGSIERGHLPGRDRGSSPACRGVRRVPESLNATFTARDVFSDRDSAD